jgi:RNA polymerase sigma-70 factor, ECF subfamily
MSPTNAMEPLSREGPLTHSEVYERHWRDVGRWVARLGGPMVDVEDLVHEVFLEVFAALSSFRQESKLTTWLFRITARTVSVHRRRARWRRWLAGLPNDYAKHTSALTCSPSEDSERRDAAKVLYAALDTLNADLRTTFILAELEEMSATQIADIQNISESTVWVRLHRARKRLSKHIPIEFAVRSKREDR